MRSSSAAVQAAGWIDLLGRSFRCPCSVMRFANDSVDLRTAQFEKLSAVSVSDGLIAECVQSFVD